MGLSRYFPFALTPEGHDCSLADFRCRRLTARLTSERMPATRYDANREEGASIGTTNCQRKAKKAF